MSVKLMSLVFDRYPSGGGERLLALALADHAHDDGSRVFPSVARLAVKSVQSERTVQYQLRKMEQIGWLIRVSDASGGRGNTTEYCISPDWIKGANLAPFIRVKRVQPDTERVQPDALKGATAVAPESSVTIREPSDARAIPREAFDPEKQKPPSIEKSIVWDSEKKIFTGIGEPQMRSWEEAFPKLDLDSELTRIELWYENNPKKRKRNLKRFITGWLSRAFRDLQDRGKPRVFAKPTAPASPR